MLRAAAVAVLALTLVATAACRERTAPKEGALAGVEKTVAPTSLATFGGGCFWCAEALFRRIEGVVSVESGFSGGSVTSPSYETVCEGGTGHAEVVQVRYDPKRVAYEQLLEIFWKTHDPTTKNRQGHDVGTQYRSIVLYHDAEQRKIAESVKADLEAAKIFPGPIVTEIVPYVTFWKADEHHQDYFARNGDEGYCKYVIAPKVEKLEKVFKDRLRKKP